MSNHDLTQDLRAVLRNLVVNGQNITDATIAHFLGQEIKEVEIGRAIPADIQTDQVYITTFVANLHNTLIATTNVSYANGSYDLGGYGLSGPTDKAAGEDLSAIKKYGDLGSCDLVKAITNLLRLIKTAERIAVE
ncbi:MAG: hypothetical protein AAF293_13035 [Pseudomonadota bacterium]